jgi:hypothetical protein
MIPSKHDLANLATALIAAQVEIHNPSKNRDVTVRPKDGGPSYTFSYATLDAILDGVRPILAKHGLALVQTLVNEGDKKWMRTALLHVSGECIHTDIPLSVDRPGNQALGSAMTYARRYGIISILALCADEDDDANGADGNELQFSNQRPPPTRQQSPPRPATPPPPPRPPENVAVKKGQPPAPAPAPAVKPPPSPEAIAAKQEHDRIMASLTRKIGAEEAQHQVKAIKDRNGPKKWKESVAEMKALDDSTPAT